MPEARRRKTKTNTNPANKSTKSSNTPPTSQSFLRKFALFVSAVFAGSVLWILFTRIGHDGAWSLTRSQRAWAKDDDYASPFFVADLPGRGKGLLASREIKQGELLLREKPLFVVPHRISSSPAELIGGLVAQLSQDEQETFFNLSYVNFPKNLDPDKHRNEVALAIFQTNAVAAGDGVGIFPRMARLNHGCSSAFNVVYTWREKERALYVHALKSINKGRELLTSYTNTKRGRHQRRAYLAEHYGFECQCSVCSLPEGESQASDKRLEGISEAYEGFASWGAGHIDGGEAVAHARKIWELGEEEGYWSERGRLASDAAWVAASHSDALATREWAALGAEWYGYEVGADSEQAEELRGIAGDAGRHSGWGTRRGLAVGGPGR